MQTISITAHPEDASQVEAIKAVLKVLNVKFEVSKDKNYNIEFLAKIRQSEKEIAQGKTQRVNKNELKQLLGL